MVRQAEMEKKAGVALSPGLEKARTELRLGNLLRKNPNGLRFKELVEGTNRTKRVVSARVKDWCRLGYVKHDKRLYILTANGEHYIQYLEGKPFTQEKLKFDKDVILFQGTELMATVVFVGYQPWEAENTYNKLTETLSGHNVHGSVIFRKPKEEK